MSALHPAEGVIQFRGEHREETLDPRRDGPTACRLLAWREILARTGLVGQEPSRYEGFGYGNVSGRVGPPGAPRGRRGFLVTGTQTSGRVCMSLDDLSRVESWDLERNRVASRGRVLPSSESLTHAALYDLGPEIRFVFHVHSPVLWRRARELRLPTTEPSVPYGTPEMAQEVVRLYRSTVLPERRLFAMGGHDDGIVAFGRDAEEAGRTVLRWLARAYEAECAEGVSLCRID